MSTATETVMRLWQEGKADLLTKPHCLVIDLIVRVFGRSPPSDIAAFYQEVPGGFILSHPVIGVNFEQPGSSLIENYNVFDDMINLNYWPILGDGFGNYYVAFEDNDEISVGFVDVMIDPSKPSRIVANSIEAFFDQLEIE